MKRAIFIFVPLLFVSYLAGRSVHLALPQQKDEIRTENNLLPFENGKMKDDPSERIKQKLQCTSCHTTDVPTKHDPALLSCPRNSMISVDISPMEGPDVVTISEMSSYYTGVKFPHRIHAEMSEMSGGCNGCHHYNTAGPVLNCRNCHELSRKREDISLPDLKAAFHRQCISCHKQWSGDNGCNDICHKRKGSETPTTPRSTVNTTHPAVNQPDKIVWETRSKTNKIVTFFHGEHINLFKLGCKNCHDQESCIKCHTPKGKSGLTEQIKLEKSVEDHHKPCSNCHLGNSCYKCHQDKEMTSFSHAKTSGWGLKSYHSSLECSKCHGSRMPYRKLDNRCISCHKKFASSFDHKLVGFVFSENHSSLECSNCHAGNDLLKNPVCADCHDDKSFPNDVPGKRIAGR